MTKQDEQLERAGFAYRGGRPDIDRSTTRRRRIMEPPPLALNLISPVGSAIGRAVTGLNNASYVAGTSKGLGINSPVGAKNYLAALLGFGHYGKPDVARAYGRLDPRTVSPNPPSPPVATGPPEVLGPQARLAAALVESAPAAPRRDLTPPKAKAKRPPQMTSFNRSFAAAPAAAPSRPSFMTSWGRGSAT